MTLVEVRCKTCRRVLATIGDMVPHDLNGALTVPACPKHGRRGGYRQEKLRQLLRAGHRPVITAALTIAAADLAPHIEKARRTARTVVVTV